MHDERIVKTLRLHNEEIDPSNARGSYVRWSVGEIPLSPQKYFNSDTRNKI
jgi:hypothetical protein